jgi:hypothetical protein
MYEDIFQANCRSQRRASLVESRPEYCEPPPTLAGGSPNPPRRLGIRLPPLLQSIGVDHVVADEPKTCSAPGSYLASYG